MQNILYGIVKYFGHSEIPHRCSLGSFFFSDCGKLSVVEIFLITSDCPLYRGFTGNAISLKHKRV